MKSPNLLLAFITVTAGLTGCGGDRTPVSSASNPAAEPPAAPAAAEAVTPTASAVTPPKPDEPVAEERKWLGKIPYDVWFDDPLAVAGDSASVAAPVGAMAAMNSPGPPTVAESPPDSEPGSSTANGDAADWSKFITAALLEEEVKRIRNFLNSSMQSVGQFNGNYQQIAMEGPTLGALAQVAVELPDAPSWATQVPHIRRQAKKVGDAADGLGRQAFDATTVPFENLISLLNNNVPAGLEQDVPEREPFNEFAGRSALMLRMDKAAKWLTSNLNTEARLKSEQDTARVEAAVLAVLSKIIADESYDSAIDEDYITYAKAMIDSSLEVRQAIEANDFEAFTTAIGKANKNCSDCHTDYRFSDDI